MKLTRKTVVVSMVFVGGAAIGLILHQLTQTDETAPAKSNQLPFVAGEPETLEDWRLMVRESIRQEEAEGEESERLTKLKNFSRFLESSQAEKWFGLPLSTRDDQSVRWPVGDYNSEWPPKDPSFMEPRGDGLPPDPKRELRSFPPADRLDLGD